MSVPAEHLDALLAYAENVLRGELDRFIDTGELSSSIDMGGVSGPQQAAFEYRRSGISIQPLTAQERAAEDAWHNYWRPLGHHTIDPELSRGAPPRPPGRHGSTYTLSWDRARSMLRSRRDQRRGETDGGQLEMFAAA